MSNLWQYILMLIVLVCQIKGYEMEANFSPHDLDSQSSVLPEHESRNDVLSNDSSEDSAEATESRSGILVSTRRPMLCYYSPDKGQCNLKYPRYYYDYTVNRCRVFLYTGCGGNTNRFLTRTQCIKVCKPY
ncbi:early lactation protein-like [Pararge aegeria]|uniref:early lactation protein-like n=1 Tax=Pararge aegeria TaxID=116150 RepID=UPI0019D092E8|nr:early lactation protein-like [Pararge aegeria]